MSVSEVSAYIKAQPEPKRSTLEAVRKSIMEIEPKFEQVIAWGSPQFKINGKYAVGLCAFKNHLIFSPQSAEVLAAHSKELEGYVVSKSSFQFSVDKPIPKALLKRLIVSRLKELAGK